MNNVYVLAKALVFARTGELDYREDVIDNLMAAIGTEQGGRTLALGRELVAYVIAADLVNLPAEEDEDRRFRSWLRQTLTEPLDGSTLQATQESRPNNWGTHAGASRVAVALYLGDEEELDRAAKVFKGWLGDRDVYTGFEYGKLYWQADPDHPVGINILGAMKDGYSIDGAQPEEMRRGGEFRWPPEETGYPWEALQGALTEAELLSRAGYDVWRWEDSALLRAVQFLYRIGWPPDGDDVWLPWLINHAYGTDYATSTPARPGKNMGWTDWTHSRARDHAFENGEQSSTDSKVLGTKQVMIEASQ
ncbi:MAG: alginate lyase family protein [Anaerolineaceae bacterium]|nr:MAG: alginate lyase family protein [Anaerolineaceae bacterium]